MKLEVRAATAADLDRLAEMNRRLIEDEGHRNPMALEGLRNRMQGWLESGEWAVDLFFDGDEVVGYAVHRAQPDAHFPQETEVYLRQFYVERERRGRGLGGAALEALAAARFPAGCTVVVEVLASNPRGERFWARSGFAPYATTLKRRLA